MELSIPKSAWRWAVSPVSMYQSVVPGSWRFIVVKAWGSVVGWSVKFWACCQLNGWSGWGPAKNACWAVCWLAQIGCCLDWVCKGVGQRAPWLGEGRSPDCWSAGMKTQRPLGWGAADGNENAPPLLRWPCLPLPLFHPRPPPLFRPPPRLLPQMLLELEDWVWWLAFKTWWDDEESVWEAWGIRFCWF